MKISERIFIVGSGNLGFEMTDPNDCHVYLIDGGDELALIDIGAGMGEELILQNIEKLGFNINNIKYVCLTHPHADHAGGAAYIKEDTGAKIIASKGCSKLLREGDEQGINLTLARKAGVYPQDYKLKPCFVDLEVVDGDLIQVGDISLSVIETPGHCESHISYFGRIGETNVLFAGDTIFYGGKVLLINTHDCNLQEYSETAAKLSTLNVDTMLPGHGLLALRNGGKHLQKAAAIFSNMGIPQNILD